MDLGDLIERFLHTGEVDARAPGWPRRSRVERAAAEDSLRAVLAKVVRYRAHRAPGRGRGANGDPPELSASALGPRLSPMLEGLLGVEAAGTLLAALPGRLLVPSPQNFEALAARLPPSVAWSLANLLLDDLGAPTLADDVPVLDGFCWDARAYIAGRALRARDLGGDARDVVVHELAHLLHDVPNGVFGLRPAKAPPIAVPPARQETFAYAVELFSCRLRDGRWPSFDALLHDRRVDAAALVALRLGCEADLGAGWSLLRHFGAEGALTVCPGVEAARAG